MNGNDETVRSEKVHARELAHALVEEAWNLAADPLVLNVQYEAPYGRFR